MNHNEKLESEISKMTRVLELQVFIEPGTKRGGIAIGYNANNPEVCFSCLADALTEGIKLGRQDMIIVFAGLVSTIERIKERNPEIATFVRESIIESKKQNS
jgi:hypothetical protein